MKTFKQYVENRNSQEYSITRAINQLCYGKGYTPEAIERIPSQQLIADIEEMSLLPTASWPVGRFAAMIKIAARMHTENMPLHQAKEID